jgi:hypothetical protein
MRHNPSPKGSSVASSPDASSGSVKRQRHDHHENNDMLMYQPGQVKHPAIPVRARAEPTQRSILFVDCAPGGVPGRNSDPGIHKKRKDVRSHAATASAAKRKATIAKKEAQQKLLHLQRLGLPVEKAVDQLVAQRPRGAAPTPFSNAFKQLVELVTELQGDRVWYLDPIERSSLAHKALRSILWDAMINSATLFQAAAFVAATHCNSCGLPSTAVHMGSGLILLRGASFNAVQAAITSSNIDSLTPVGIALLAGWERRYGDPESFQVHMQAWKCLSLPSKSLDENHVATLADLTLETFREALDERAETSSGGFKIVKSPQVILDLTTLPPGFKVFHVRSPEARSLLEIASLLTRIDPRASDAIDQLRRISLENLAWSPHHTHSSSPSPAHEDAWDQLELKALYHVRAAQISLIGLTLQNSMDFHGSEWTFDMKTALAVHTTSCQHLATDVLMETKFKEVAVWSRFIMCATSADPPRDVFIRELLRQVGITTWEQMRKLLRKFIYYEPIFEKSCQAFYEHLAQLSDDDVPRFTEIA